jgi:hypothetical protein
MDKQREMFEAWWKYNRPDYGEDYHPDMQYHAWNAWQAAQKVQWQPIETIQKESVLALLKGYDPDNKEYAYAIVVWKDGEWLLSDSLNKPCFTYTEWSNCLTGLPTE